MRKQWMYLLHVQKSELTYRVYKSQKNAFHPGDWVKLIEKDRCLLELNISNDEIEKLSKSKFKNIINKKIERYTLTQLNDLKERHSKSDYLNSSSFKTAQYLVDSRFSKSEIASEVEH